MRLAYLPILFLAWVASISGCGNVTWRSYHGSQDWATGSGFSSKAKDGLLIYEGLPDRHYEVLGIAEAQGPANFITQPMHRKKMHEMIRKNGGNAMIIIGREIIRTGSSGSYQGQAYGSCNYVQQSGSTYWHDNYNYALAILAIRLTNEKQQSITMGGRDPMMWARSVLAGGTSLLGSETGQ